MCPSQLSEWSFFVMRPWRYCRFLRRCVFFVAGITTVPAVFMILAGSEPGIDRLHEHASSQLKVNLNSIRQSFFFLEKLSVLQLIGRLPLDSPSYSQNHIYPKLHESRTHTRVLFLRCILNIILPAMPELPE